jgi:hypothetical protein
MKQFPERTVTKETIMFSGEPNVFYKGSNGLGQCKGIEVSRSEYPGDKVRGIELTPINLQGVTKSCNIEVPLDAIEGLIALLRSVGNPSEKDPHSVESLMAQYGNWGEHETYTREDWGQETGLKNTQRGYWDWVQHRIEMDQEVEN